MKGMRFATITSMVLFTAHVSVAVAAGWCDSSPGNRAMCDYAMKFCKENINTPYKCSSPPDIYCHLHPNKCKPESSAR